MKNNNNELTNELTNEYLVKIKSLLEITGFVG